MKKIKMKCIVEHSLYLVIVLLFANVQIGIGQISANDAIQGECTLEPNVSQIKKWFDEKEHKLNNPEIKYRVGGILVYDDKLHFVNKHLRDVDIYKFNLKKETWKLTKDLTLVNAMELVYKDKVLASGMGAVELVGDTLFLCGLSKGPFCAININTKEQIYYSEVEMPDGPGSDVEAGVAFSYPIAYIAFHSIDYKITDVTETQRLFAIDVETDSILYNRPLHPSEKRRDAVHGLTIVNDEIWHVRDQSLVKMNKKNGEIIEKYVLEDIGRPTSLCYYKNSLWIMTYFGGLFEVPLECK